MLFGIILTLLLNVYPDGSKAETSQIVVTKSECKRLIRHSASADVAYQAGVDVRGKKVKGADLNGGSRIKNPKEISFNYGIDLNEKYGLGSSGAMSGTATLGRVKVKGGRVYWNGEPMDGRDQAAIERACKNTYGK